MLTAFDSFEILLLLNNRILLPEILSKVKHLALIASVPALMLISACSHSHHSQSWISRTWHNTTTRYNGYFYADLKMNGYEKSLLATSEDDYTKLLPVFPGVIKTGAKSNPDMDSIIKKCTVDITLHSDKKTSKAKSKWIDDCYLLIGKSYFYKGDFESALATFQYITTEFKNDASSSNHKKSSHHKKKKKKVNYRKLNEKNAKEKDKLIPEVKLPDQTHAFFDFLKHKPARNEALLWLIKSYVALGKRGQADAIISLVEQTPDFPNEMRSDLEALHTQIFLDQNDYKNAIDPLKKTIALTKNRKEKMRYLYLLGQVFQLANDNNNAARAFKAVLDLKPEYEMAFYARINMAKSFEDDGKTDVSEVIAMLEKMARDGKNEEFRDQIYYALALIYDKQDKKEPTISSLKKSIQFSTDNNQQKGLSNFMLGGIYFADEKYRPATPCYDSAVAFLVKEDKNLPLATDRKNILDLLAGYLNVIHTQDSLQTLGRLPKAELEKKVEDIIQKMHDDQALKDSLAKQVPQNNDEGDKTQPNGTGKTFYFYNAAQKGSGYNEFISKWGKRTLEDNWRRSNKKSDAGGGDVSDGGDTRPDVKGGNDDALKNQMLADIPTTPEQVEISNDKIVEAYYAVGGIYKDRLLNNRLGIATFEELLKKFPDNKYKLETYYTLYLLYNVEKKTAEAEKYKKILLEQYPDSPFAKVLMNANYIAETKSRENEVEQFYETTFSLYTEGNYSSTINNVKQAREKYNGNALQPKFDMLEALCIGATKPRNDFKAALKNVIARNPQDEVRGKAEAILKILEAKMLQDSLTSVTPPEPSTPYTYRDNQMHYFVIALDQIFPDSKGMSDSINNYNTRFHSLDNLKLTSQMLDKNQQLIVVKDFPNGLMAMVYFNEVMYSKNWFKTIPFASWRAFVIDDKNYSLLLKRKDTREYFEFYNKNYK